jgi:hypothetical protein
MRLFNVVLCATVVGCTAVTSSAPVVAADTDFEVPHGGSVRISGSALTVTFDSVSEDSRCPTDVQCVWEGNATLHLTVDSATLSRRAELRTSGVRQPASAYGFLIELRALRPVPTTQARPRQQDYIATLRVTRQSG